MGNPYVIYKVGITILFMLIAYSIYQDIIRVDECEKNNAVAVKSHWYQKSGKGYVCIKNTAITEVE